MIVYIAFLGIITLYSFLGITGRKISGGVYFLMVIVIALFAACRENGYDWLSYAQIYRDIQNGVTYSDLTFIEYGFELLCRISPTYRFLIAIVALISVIVTLGSIYRLNRNYLPLLGLLIFVTTLFFPVYMGQIRQGLAIGFVSLAIYERYSLHNKASFVLIVIASFFHISALISLSIFFIPFQNIGWKYYMLILLGAVFFSALLLPIFANLFQYSQFGFVQKIMFYAENEPDGLGITSTILIRICTFVLALKLNQNSDRKIDYICNVYLVGIVLYLLFGFLPQLAGRGSLYFTLMEIVLLPFIISRLRSKPTLYLCGYLLVVALSYYRFISFFSEEFNVYSYIPY